MLALDAARDADLAAIPDSQAKADGMAVGLAAANAMIALRMNDGSATPPLTWSPPPGSAGDYQLTTGCLAGVFYNWPQVTPFGIRSPEDFLLPAPPSLISQEYAKDDHEAGTMGASDSADRPPDRTDVARLYAVTSPNLVASLAMQIFPAANGFSPSENAWSLALINMAINDSPDRVVLQQVSL